MSQRAGQDPQTAAAASIPELGTIATEEGFRKLYEMDTIQHVRPGVQYPPVTFWRAGLPDWQPRFSKR
jgi:hypothetical protein